MKSVKKELVAGAILILVLMLFVNAAVALTYPIRCQSLSGVTDETGVNLIDGGSIQIICTGADGSIDSPDSNGNPLDDDWLVDTTYAGCGFKLSEPNSGKFDTNVNTTNLSEGDIIYCRAWNVATITDATYYGDSGTYTIPASADEHDFGTWSTDKEKPILSPTPTPFTTPIPSLTPTASPSHSPAQIQTPTSGEQTPSPAPSLSPFPALTPATSPGPTSSPSPTLTPAKPTPSPQTPAPTATEAPMDVKVLISSLAISIVIALRKRKRYKT